MIIHTVKRGESLGQIAAAYEISPVKLRAANGLPTEELIPGEQLLVLIPTRTATARRGEGLEAIAHRFETTMEALLALNPELEGRPSVYDGQPITVRQEAAQYGLGIANGYLYRGATRAQLMRALPYLSYLTVCSAVARRGSIGTLFDGGEAAKLASAAGKLPILRLRVADGESLGEELIRSAALMAKGGGYRGLALSGGSPTAEVMAAAAELTAEAELCLIYERDAEDTSAAPPPGSLTLLTYDKLHLTPTPSFAEGEERILGRYADEHDALRTFLDLSPFALSDGKYVTKGEARAAVLRAGGSLEPSEDGCCLRAVCRRRGREKSWLTESLLGTRRKLELISELGFFGVGFDVARTPIAELMMFASMFSRGIGGL